MKLCWILLVAAFLIDIYVPCEGFLSPTKLQDFIDKYVDIERFKQEGITSLNITAMEHIWNYFKTKFQRHYRTTDEEKERIRIFRDHLKRVLQSNLQHKRSFKLALNEFADLTNQEFLQLKTGLKVPSYPPPDIDNNQGSSRRAFKIRYQNDYYGKGRSKRSLYQRQNHNERFLSDWFWDFFNQFNNEDDGGNDVEQPTNSFDWRDKGVVTSIKNQESCGSCYAFASAAVMESLYAIKTKSQSPIDLSPQQIVDCSTENSGCNGGLFDPTVSYITSNGGNLATEESYPYTGIENTCKTDGISEVDLGTIQYEDIERGDENGMAEKLVQNGPMFIGLHVDVPEFMFYKSGILSVPNCPNGRADMQHALTLVGYGYDENTQQSYWIIKNSWGAGWGENGYVRLARNKGNMCGVTTLASSATLV